MSRSIAHYWPSYEGEVDDPENYEVAKILGIHVIHAYGYIRAFRTNYPKAAGDGRFIGGASQVERLAHWDGKAGALAVAFTQAGVLEIDEDGTLVAPEPKHELYAAATIRMREGAKKRAKNHRSAQKELFQEDEPQDVVDRETAEQSVRVRVRVPSRVPSLSFPLSPSSSSASSESGGGVGEEPDDASLPEQPRIGSAPEPLGPYGEKFPTTVDAILSYVHDGKPLKERWESEHAILGIIGVRRALEQAVAHRAALQGPMLRRWWWPAAFIGKVDTWMSEASRKAIEHAASLAKAEKFGAKTDGAPPKPTDPRRQKLIAYWRAHAHEDLPPFHVWAERAEADGTADKIIGRGPT